jgi:RHH-type transcriptional regulator, rel operon repressor / antitoxin RelB
VALATLTIHVTENDQGRLDALARSTGRSPSSLAEEALSEYLAVNEWQIAGIKAAIEDLERGERVEHKAVREWVESWGSDNELKPPGASRGFSGRDEQSTIFARSRPLSRTATQLRRERSLCGSSTPSRR